MLKKAVTPGSFLKNYLFTLLIVFLALFMFGVLEISGNFCSPCAFYRPNLTDCSKISANTDSLRFMGFYHCRVYSDHVSE